MKICFGVQHIFDRICVWAWMRKVIKKCDKLTITVADSGFPRGRRRNSKGGPPHTILPIFPKNCMKLKEFGSPRGASLAPALRSATELSCLLISRSLGKSLYK